MPDPLLTVPPKEKTSIPEDLRKQLEEFQKALWRIKMTEAILAGIFGLITSFLIVFLLERLFPIPGPARLIILLAGTSLCLFFTPLWIRRWIYGHRRKDQLARLISQKFPKFGDRLLGVVELQNQNETGERFSLELREAAMIHVAKQAAGRDIKEALPDSSHHKLGIGVITGLIVVVLGFTIAPKAGSNALKRWLMPLSDTQHYTFTQFDTTEIPTPYIVPFGENFTFTAPLKSTSDQRPELARASYNGQDHIQVALSQNGTYSFDFPGQEQAGEILLEAGDASLTLDVIPHFRPEIDHFEALVTLPKYLQLPPRKINSRSGSLTALEGSEVVLKAFFTREIQQASADFSAKALETEPLHLTPPMAETQSPEQFWESQKNSTLPPVQSPASSPVPPSRPLKLHLTGSQLTTEALPIGLFRAKIPFTWIDVLGLRGTDSFELNIEGSKDLPPAVHIQGIERKLVILPEETLEFDIIAEDDFGLREIGIAWKGEITKASKDRPADGSLTIQPGSPSATRLSDRVIFSPQAYRIGPQKIELMAYTTDYKDERGRVYSEPITLYILTREEHSQILKSRFERIISELEDAARKEINNLDLNERLDKTQSASELQSEKNQQKLARAQKNEAANATAMKEIAKKMQSLFEDATRNGQIDPQTMKSMADAMTNIKELGETDLPSIEAKLGETQNQKSAPEKTESDLKEAIKKQKEAVKKMQDTIERTNAVTENFETSTFVNRLKKAANDEIHISSALQSAFRGETENAVLPILGAAPDSDDIDPVHTRLIQTLSKDQQKTTSDVRWIQEDLERFHARTKKPIHKEVFLAMEKSHVGENLERLRHMISENRTFTSATLSQKWSKTLKEWANKLEGSKNQSNGGGGGGGGAGSSEDQDFEFMLRVMRMVQAEQDIRSQTRSLEQMLRSLKLSKPQN